MQKKSIVCLLLILVMAFTGINCTAETVSYAPYKGYEYNDAGESQLAPIGYKPEGIAFNGGVEYGQKIGNIKSISSAMDLSGAEWYFLLDNEKSCVYRLNSNYELYGVYDNFKDKNGQNLNISNATGFYFSFVNNCTVIIFANRVVITDILGRQTAEILVNAAFVALKNADIAVVTADNRTAYSTYSYDGSFIEKSSVGFSIDGLAYDSLNDSVITLNVTDKKIVSVAAEMEYFFNFDLSANISFFAGSTGDMFYIFDKGTKNIYFVSAYGEEKRLGKTNFGILGIDSVNQRFIGFKNGVVSVIEQSLKSYIDIKRYTVKLNNPTDMVVSGNNLFILDAGNSRIIETDIQMDLVKKIYFNIYDSIEGSLSFMDAKGMVIAENGDFLIADTENFRVIRCTKNGVVRKIITKPDGTNDEESPFRASKVLEDRNGCIYVIADSINLGAFVFDKDYEFVNYYGSNTVVQTAKVIMNYIKRKFMTREQIESSEISIPIALADFDIDADGFIYTVSITDQTTNATAEIRKLNYKGENVIETRETSDGYGDLEWDRQSDIVNTSFIDITVDNEGFMHLVDQSRGKIFQYSPQGQLVTVFGGFGEQVGLFKEPICVKHIEGKVYVLDKAAANITVFNPTDYTVCLRSAIKLLDDADGSKALGAWQEVLKMNTNSLYPYYGIGIAYQTLGDYEKAMENFKLSGAKIEYSKAFKEYRKSYLQKNLWWIALLIIAVICVAVVLVKIAKKRMIAEKGEVYSLMESRKGMPLYVLLHPVDGFEQLKYRNMHSLSASIIIVLAWFFISVINFFFTGFIFNQNRPIDYSLILTLTTTIILFALFVLANWCMASFLDGKGRMKDIIVVTAYSLTPMLTAMLVKVFMSNILCIEEQTFMSIVMAIGYIWTGIVLVLGMYAIHSYSFGKTIISVILSIISIVVIALLVALFFAMLQQAFNFIESIIYEIRIR